MPGTILYEPRPPTHLCDMPSRNTGGDGYWDTFGYWNKDWTVYFTSHTVGTIWQCDDCGRVWEVNGRGGTRWFQRRFSPILRLKHKLR